MEVAQSLQRMTHKVNSLWCHMFVQTELPIANLNLMSLHIERDERDVVKVIFLQNLAQGKALCVSSVSVLDVTT